MPQVPTYESGRVSPNQLPSFRFTPSATLEAFGGRQARDLQRFGSVLSDTGDKLAREFLIADAQSRIRTDKAKARDSLNNARSEARQYMASIYQKKGKEAIDIYGEVEDTFGKIRSNAMNGLENEDQKNYFAASFDSLMDSNLNKAIAYQENERAGFEKKTLAAENKGVIEDAIVSNADPKVVADSEATIIANTKQMNRGAGAEQIKELTEDAISNLHLSIADTFSKESPEKALEYLRANWKKLNPILREDKKKKLSELAELSWIRNKAQELMASGATLEQQLSIIDNIKDAERAEKLKVLVKNRYKEKEDLIKLENKVLYETEVDKLMSDPFNYELPLDMNADNQIKLYNLQAKLRKEGIAEKGVGAASKTDWNLYNDLLKLPYEEFRKKDIPFYADRLAKSEIKELIKLQRKGRLDYKNAQTLTSYVNQLVKDTFGPKLSSSEYQESVFLRELFENELNKYPENQKNKIEIWNKVKDSIMLEVDVKGSWFDSPYWEAKYKGAEIIAPDVKPANIPEGAKWVDNNIGGVSYRGWEFTNPEGVKFLYSTDGNKYRVN